MVSIAHLAGRKAVALLSDMNQPLGFAVGNALELKEAIETLHGGGPQDFREHCLIVAGHMLAIGGVAPDAEAGMHMAEQQLLSGGGWEHFKTLVTAQGGDVAYVEHPERLPSASLVETVSAPRSGYLSGVHAREVGETAVFLGAGREKKDDPIDHAVGVVIHRKVGERVRSRAAVIYHPCQPASAPGRSTPAPVGGSHLERRPGPAPTAFLRRDSLIDIL